MEILYTESPVISCVPVILKRSDIFCLILQKAI